MTTKIECEVCCVDNTRKQTIICQACEYKACKGCTERYLQMTDTDPQCMNCKTIWGLDFLQQSFTKKFINTELKNHRKEILYQRESTQFEASQQFAEQEKQKRKAIELYESLKKQKADMLREMRQLDRTIVDLKNQITTGQIEGPANTNKTYVSRKCPIEECRGFMKCEDTEQIMTCGLCTKTHCKLCNDPIDDIDSHICDKEKKDSLECIMKHSMACPSCGIPIQKSEGCDQMWCVQCHTTFSYSTGKIETGRCHNPLYLEWRRANNRTRREQDDYLCGGLPSRYTIRDVVNSIFGFNVRVYARGQDVTRYTHTTNKVREYFNGRDGQIDNVYRIAETLQRLLQNKYRIDTRLNHQHITTKYLLQELDIDDYKKRLYEHEKQFQKNRDIGYCVHLASHGFVDLFHRLSVCKTEEEMKEIITEMLALKDYYNNELTKISKRYGNLVVPVINQEWNILERGHNAYYAHYW